MGEGSESEPVLRRVCLGQDSCPGVMDLPAERRAGVESAHQLSLGYAIEGIFGAGEWEPDSKACLVGSGAELQQGVTGCCAFGELRERSIEAGDDDLPPAPHLGRNSTRLRPPAPGLAAFPHPLRPLLGRPRQQAILWFAG